ncbi:MAG: c-type cytochrome [Bacteroidota bacterium]|nr:c-type cytochrome [Bacteroidota bacterium]
MKKILAFGTLLLVLASCGSNSSSDNSAAPATDSTATTSTTDITQNPDYQKGLALVSKNNCLTCHKIDEKLVGPAYRDVAQKYAGNDTAVAYLAKKVITGGKGVWGQVPMTPHPDLSMADAETMVRYILLLKNQ